MPAHVRLAVVGADHLHVFQIVHRLRESGVETAAHAPRGGLIDGYASWASDSVERPVDEILADPSIDMIVTAAVPCDRADISLAAIRAGKHVVSDKPGVTTREQLDAIRAELRGRPGRPWTVLFSERFENRAIAEAVRLARRGEIGRVVHVLGAGPHLLSAEHRPDWFWDDRSVGGILVDIGAHQADQFLAIAVGDDGDRGREAVVRTSAVGNVACPDHPHMQDIGSMSLQAGGVVGDHRLDYLTPPGLGVWGDVRLTIVGTEGTLEARANIDPAGLEGGEHLIHVGDDGVRRLDLTDLDVGWAETLLDDIADGGERMMSQAHVLNVCRLTLDAQAAASPWGGESDA